MHAVVVGATGATGRELVAQLLQRDGWEKVVTLGRRRLTQLPAEYSVLDLAALERSGRLVQHEVDMETMESRTAELAGADAVFCTLGTTRSAAGSADAMRRVDLDYVRASAVAAKAAGVPHFALLTAQGANADIWYSEARVCHGLFYTWLKGQAEREANAQGFSHTSIYRPGLLDRGDKARWAERMALAVLPNTHVRDVARAMIATAERLHGAPPQAAATILDTAQIKAAAAAAS